MTESNPDYAIVVPAFNEAALLPHTLAAMWAAMRGADAELGVRGELVVVDNNSTDATAEVARGLGARVVFEPVNMIAKARNAGAWAAKADRLVFVDADTSPSAELLIAALRALEEPGTVGGGAVIHFDVPPPWLTGKLAGGWNLVSRLFGYPAGCFIFCRKEAFDAVRGFNETVYASEEIWLARRLKKWGAGKRPKQRVRVLPTPVVTSSRKMDHGLKMYSMLLLMFFFPFAVKFKGLCGYWYKRQDRPTEPA